MRVRGRYLPDSMLAPLSAWPGVVAVMRVRGRCSCSVATVGWGVVLAVGWGVVLAVGWGAVLAVGWGSVL